MSWKTSTPSPDPAPFTAAVRPAVARGRGLALPAAARPGFGLVLAAFAVRGGSAAGFPPASAFAAAALAAFAGVPEEAARFAPDSRFALRLPGLECGRFPSTPPSSVMDGDSSSARTGYTELANVDDKVVRELDWLTG
jgi:hypothetical protein